MVILLVDVYYSQVGITILSGALPVKKPFAKGSLVHFEIPKKDRQQNVMKNLTGAMYVMNMARK